MDRHYSTLELAMFDETTRAPERDYDATAFELDTGALAPQPIHNEAPQVIYDSSLPEAQESQESNKERGPSLYTTKSAPKSLWIIIALVVIVALAIGVAVGIWRHREHSRSSSTSNQSSLILSPPVKQFILNDTSLVAVSEGNGNRYLFFQDPAGLIRGAVRTDNNWSTNLNLGMDSNAKNHTPLAAIAPTTGNFVVLLAWLSEARVFCSLTFEQITLFYVSEVNALNSSTYDEGSWSTDTAPGSLSLGNFSIGANTRSLSAASTGIAWHGNETITDQELLLYENPAGKVSALCLVFGEVQGNNTIDAWVDITSQESKSLLDEFRNTPASTAEGFSRTLSESLGSNVSTLSAPFTCARALDNSTQPSYIYAFFSSPNASNFEFVSTEYSTGPNGAGNFSLMSPVMTQRSTAVQDYSSIDQSDIAVFGNFAIWINHTQPVIVATDKFQNATPPDSVFPFTRLTSTTLSDDSVTYLYHQINGTTIAEEQWDPLANAWIATEYVSISY